MICVDDLNDWVGCLGGHPDAITPNIDALAARGRNFSNAHCSVTVCSPSRVSVMSGLGPTTHGSYELGPAYQSIERLNNVPTLQGYFKRQGYTTLSGGKVLHHGFKERLADDIDVVISDRRGGPRPKEPMSWVGSAKAWDWGAFPPTDAEMYDFQLAEAAAEALGEAYEKPFFMSVGLFRPHVPMFVPPKWFDLYDHENITMPWALKEDMDDVPPNFQYKMGVAPPLAEIQEAKKWRKMVHAYLASTSFVDHCVGVVLKGLERGPNEGDTIVVLWSDHGFHLGEKQHLAKRTLWEESTRVPFIVAGLGIESGVDCREAVSLLDVYPTLVELCGLPENGLLEGVSVVPQLNDPAAVREEPAISSSYFGNHAVRTRDWRYIRYADGAEELYDHRSDPGERDNLAGEAAHDATKVALAKWLPVDADATPEVKPPEEQEQRRQKAPGKR
jgi:choline-sulfatase